jgi:hypothetical protein
MQQRIDHSAIAIGRPCPHIADMRILALIVPLFVILAASIWWAAALWTSIEGPPMPASGHVAMWLGIIFSLVIGCGLMALMFFSSRRGYDEQADGRAQRARTAEDIRERVPASDSNQ